MGETKTEPWAIDFDDWIIEKYKVEIWRLWITMKAKHRMLVRPYQEQNTLYRRLLQWGVAILQTKPRSSIEAMRWGI